MSILLDVKNLKVDLPTENGMLHAVRGIDFQVRKGEMLCLVGESGCGKSMTSLALMGLLPRKAQCSADHILFDGADLNTMSERQRMQLRGKRMSMIFQEPMTSLNPAYTLGNQLCEAMLQQPGVTRGEARERALYLLHRTGISNAEDRLRQYPHQLSGGLRQRVMIAMSLMCSPDLIIADEPTTALDVTIQAQILRMIRELQQEFGTAVIFITHDLGVVSRIADRVAVMYAGQVVETSGVAQLFAQPRHPYTRGLLNCIPVRGKTLPGSRLQAIPGVVPSLVGQVSGCAFRNRCTLADSGCEQDPPMVQQGGPGLPHEARCFKLDAPVSAMEVAA
ncbi:ABC transporter ATP-binding protein [Herbaspirillum huttiense]|jgi:peptide/nickel transport system ATP-binding protein|nr:MULTISPECIES: ABC transporter ATP-binding protein [unclassified Herbaspirillum]MBP1314321.1 peptide/nickel transport system ATP-binding protein [Herbaspirillum sp. 1130]MCP3656406.1 ABC transporter ATP-binding protein [Herbaspirillum sp.]MCP3948424.1 ABC transporter ATP-binding protein [Herbaspirillum sp.]MCP4031656.1 ABC transporter ATP-binding protein [Herbaspirillum sp.]MCP4558054.1 ABC transporter ATP-binding protein [Herbaspirillum sp.]